MEIPTMAVNCSLMDIVPPFKVYNNYISHIKMILLKIKLV